MDIPVTFCALPWSCVSHSDRISFNGGIVLADERTALHHDAISTALNEARTWGEFRALLSGEWDGVEDLLTGQDGYPEELAKEAEENPDDEYDILRWDLDDTPFNVESIPGFSDGDYPDWIQQDMDAIVPESLLKRFGEYQSSVHNGDFWFIDQIHLDLLLKYLLALGYQVEDGSHLSFS